jgi:hypothetical protein
LNSLASGYDVERPMDRHRAATGRHLMILWLVAVVIAIVGVVQLLQGQILLAILLFVAACLVGPGGYSIFRGRRTA